LRIIDCPPDTGQLLEMLKDSNLSDSAKGRLVRLFETCRREHADEYATFMPFGHGVFADVVDERPDLYLLWQQRLVHMLRPPGRQPHPFIETIEAAYPWRDPAYAEPVVASAPPNT
jgi:5-methylcytosine-specific restriction protein B